jgi:hypothetical protein
MNTDLQDILNSNAGLSSKKAEFLELLKAKQSESNRLRAFYELVVLAQASLETANQIDFTGFIDCVQTEIQNLHEVARKTFEDNQAHYKWSEEVVNYLLSDMADGSRIKQLSDEIQDRLGQLDQLLSAAIDERHNKSFGSLK